MANLLVLIEVAADRPLPASLEALGQARRVGSALGATVYAVAATAEQPGYGDDDLVAVVSRHGADKVLLASDPLYRAPLRWGTHGPLLQSVCNALPPTLFVAADTPGARDLAARLAASLGAALLGDAWIEIERVSLSLSLFGGSGNGARRLEEGDLEFPVVALVPPGRYAVATGDEEAEVELLEARSPSEREFVELGVEAAAAPAQVIGDGEAAIALRQALGSSESPRLIVAVGEAALPARALAIRVAVGEGARESAADYALEGLDAPAALARALATPPPEEGA